MGLFDGLFGKKKKNEPAPKADSTNESPGAALQVVFDRPKSYSPQSLQAALRALSPHLKTATVEAIEGTFENGTPAARITFGAHAVDLVGMDVPMPKDVVEKCVQPAHYGQDIKAEVRTQQAHAMLFYASEEIDVLEQYIALCAVCAALADFGALAVLNESAMTSLPIQAVKDLATEKPKFDLLRHMPLLMLYCGFVKYFLPDKRSAWMRTYNNPIFGLPDLAMHGRIDEGESTFDMFNAMMGYLRDSGAQFLPNQTAEFGDVHVKFRAPRANEAFPTHSSGQLLILERSR